MKVSAQFLLTAALLVFIAASIFAVSRVFSPENQALAEILVAQKESQVETLKEQNRHREEKNRIEEERQQYWADANAQIAKAWQSIGPWIFGLSMFAAFVFASVYTGSVVLNKASDSVTRAILLARGAVAPGKHILPLGGSFIQLPSGKILDLDTGRVTDGAAPADMGKVIPQVAKIFANAKNDQVSSQGVDWVMGSAMQLVDVEESPPPAPPDDAGT